jgi:uncharacterized protein YoxC
MDAQPPRSDEQGLHRLCDIIQTSTNKIKLVVYPSLFAFIVLAVYGFMMIWSLTSDVRVLAQSIDTNMVIIARNMEVMSNNLTNMETHMASIDDKMNTLPEIQQNIAAMQHSVNVMTHSVRGMQHSTHTMSRDMHQMQRPMSFFSSFMPW